MQTEPMRIFKQVPRIIFGENSLNRIFELLPPKNTENDFYVFIADHVHQETRALEKIPMTPHDMIEWVDTTHEPSVIQVDALKEKIVRAKKKLPIAIVGIGGGSAMDIAKAVSVVLTNSGSAANYQGWDLVKKPGVFKVAVPTLAGTGAEASRTTVLMGKEKKYGINSDASMYDGIICDPSLLSTVPKDQRFYTAMDCYIHSVESLDGSRVNELSRAYAKKGLELCRQVLLEDADEEVLMVASYMAGASIVNSEVGICHALSYGISLVYGYHHGIANCIVFNVLDEYYNPYVDEMRFMLKKFGLALPKNVTKGASEEQLQQMVQMTLRMEKPLHNALGDNWKEIFTPEKILSLYAKM